MRGAGSEERGRGKQFPRREGVKQHHRAENGWNFG